MDMESATPPKARQYSDLHLFRNFVKLQLMKTTGRIFGALSDPTRRQILQELKEGELPAGEIVARFALSGLVASRREANRIYYRLEAEPLADTLGDFLSAVCPTQMIYRRKKRRS